MINQFCSSVWKKKIDEIKTTLSYTKGQLIFKEGNTVFGVFFIYSGKVKVFNNGINNRKQIIRFAKVGNILGHRGFGGRVRYPISASALSDSQVCFIENDLFFDVLKSNIDLTFNLMLFYAEELKNSETRMRNLSQMNTKERIVEALILVSAAYSKTNKDGSILLNVQLTRQEIADIAGTSQEQVIRTLSEFKKSKIIHTQGKKIIIIDIEKLNGIISEYETW